MPTEEDDENHGQISTTTLSASTTTLPADPAATEPLIVTTASDHPDRPVNSKPTDTTTTSSSSASTTASPSSTPAPTDPDAPDPKNGASTWLPSFLPTFGVSASTQAWIYGALTLIVIFCSGLAGYFYMARRKRLRNGAARDDYEFELLDEEEAEGLNSGEKKSAAGKKGGRRTRGGELYDAFAGGSEDDDDFEDEYRDRMEERFRGEEGPEMTEKNRSARRGVRDDDEEGEDHHVVGGSEDEESGDDSRPLRTGR